MTDSSDIGIIAMRHYDATPSLPLNIPIDQPILMVLGGDLTLDFDRGQRYLSCMHDTMRAENVTGIDVYSAVYYINDQNRLIMDRNRLFRDAGRRVRFTREEYVMYVLDNNPAVYANKLYDKLIAPRIENTGNHIRDMNAGIQNLRRLVIFAHCHGATTLLLIQNIMEQRLTLAGFNKYEIQTLMANVFAVMFAPFAPLEKIKFNAVSFASATDEVTDHHNNFSDYFYTNSHTIKPGFYGGKLGNIFIGEKLKKSNHNEHSLSGLVPTDNIDDILTDDGQIIYTAMRNAMIRGLRAAAVGKPIPDVKTLVNGGPVDFDALQKNGHAIYAEMQSDLRRMLKRDRRR